MWEKGSSALHCIRQKTKKRLASRTCARSDGSIYRLADGSVDIVPAGSVNKVIDGRKSDAVPAEVVLDPKRCSHVITGRVEGLQKWSDGWKVFAASNS